MEATVPQPEAKQTTKLATGIAGLDEILHGGLIPRRAYLVEGGPGTGKTTLGNHFLNEDERALNLFVTLGETADQLRDNARQSGLSLDDVPVLDLSPLEQDNGSESAYSLLESWEVEGGAIHDQLVAYAQQNRPERVFIDSLSQLRHLTPDLFQFRKQVLSLLRQLTRGGATVLFTEERIADGEEDLQFLSDGVIELRRAEHGRTCTVSKMRGSSFAEGSHHYGLGEGGMHVYPRLIPSDHGQRFIQEAIGSGIQGLDEMTNGGIERGTVTVLSGPSGVGKTSLGAHFIKEAAERGERSVIYSFDEGLTTFAHRLEQIGMPVHSLLEAGNMVFHFIEPLHYNPDRFALVVRDAVERRGVRVVMIDSISGYRQSVIDSNVVERLHALCRYLVNMGVTVLLNNEVQSLAGGEIKPTQDGISYLADTIILLRYIELDGELRKSLGILKKRTSDFEKSLREFEITPDGIRLREPLHGLSGLLTGLGQHNPRKEKPHGGV
jgi:circadian clock protein KaiC